MKCNNSQKGSALKPTPTAETATALEAEPPAPLDSGGGSPGALKRRVSLYWMLATVLLSSSQRRTEGEIVSVADCGLTPPAGRHRGGGRPRPSASARRPLFAGRAGSGRFAWTPGPTLRERRAAIGPSARRKPMLARAHDRENPPEAQTSSPGGRSSSEAGPGTDGAGPAPVKHARLRGPTRYSPGARRLWVRSQLTCYGRPDEAWAGS
jgi:hypothetical protein